MIGGFRLRTLPVDISNFGFLLTDVSRLYTRHFERHTGEIGVTLAQAKTLAVLARNEGITQVQLADLCDIDPMTLVRILDRMEKDAWIERRSDTGDRRVRRLYLCPPARPVLDAIVELAKKARSAALAGLSADERERLLDMLEHIHQKLADAAVADHAAPGAALPQAPVRRAAQRKRRP